MREWKEIFCAAKKLFARFWNEQAVLLYDVVDSRPPTRQMEWIVQAESIPRNRWLPYPAD